MTVPKFVHLHVKSAYSLSEGAIHVKELAKLCGMHGMAALAITDSNNLFGALEFSEVMAGAGIQPIIGCALQVAYEAELAPENALASYKNGAGPGKKFSQTKLAPILVLAQNGEGYSNLIKLVSKSYLDSEDGAAPHISLEDLLAANAGLLCLSGGPSGPLARLILAGQTAAARSLAERLGAAFAGRFYIELQRHGTADEATCEGPLLDFAYDLNLPLVASNEVYFASRGMYEAHDSLICIADGVTVGVQDRRRYTQEHYFKSSDEMIELFADLPEAIENTVVIAQRCAIKVELHDPILPNYTDDAKDEPDALRQMARDGLRARLEQAVFGATDDSDKQEELAVPYWQRFDYEMGVITEMGFSGYFLIVADFIHWAKEQNIPVGPGRGSGAGSVVAWALNITNLDPLRFGLVFERFLNPERISMPDFDIDFCQDKRDRVIRYVQEKYGHDQVAQIITFGKLQARAVLRDVGRVLQMPYGLIDRISKLVPNNPANPTSLPEALAGDFRFQEIAAQESGVDKLYDIAQKLEGLYRHASTHAAGVVIGDRPLDQLVPLYRDPRSDMPVTQFNMKWVEPAGLVKFDFLGLKTLTVLDRAIGHIRDRGQELDLDAIPLTDAATYEIISKGDTVGVFQLESSGMRDMLRKIKPDVFEDIIAIVALYRPGPMDNIPRFINVKHGREAPDYLHPWLEPVLKDTYGIIVYQEQVLQIAQVLAGYTLGQADLLRKAMGKKIKAEMDAQRATFAAGAKEKGVDPIQASTIFDLVAKFAGYGFNRAHSAAYALVGYHTAYLKANHPVEFMAASMTLDMGNTDKLNLFHQELDRMKIKLLGPDINRSDVDFAVEELPDGKAAVRYALAAVKNVGREAMRSIVRERRENGPFKDLWDFSGRIDGRQLNKRQLENLARAGAFDGLNGNRAQVHGAAELLLRFAHQAEEARNSAQVSLFGAAGEDSVAPPPRLPEHNGWTNTEALDQEYDAVGFYLSAHPLDAHQKLCERQKVKRYGDVMEALERGGSSFKLAGTVLRRQERKPASGGSPFAYVQLSDQTGMFEVTIWSETLVNCREMLEPGKSVILSITAQNRDEQVKLIANSVQDIEQASLKDVGGVQVFVRDVAAISSINGNLSRAPKGRGKVMLTLQPANTDYEVDITLNQGFALNPALRGAIKAVPGVLDVHDL